MLLALSLIFFAVYLAIALEHPLNVNKSASALIGAGLLWTIYALYGPEPHIISEQLSETLVSTAQIAFFLMGAMVIVEVVDMHDGFEVITSRIQTSSLPVLMWSIGFITFFLSAILDNLTTTIVMISLTRKLLARREDRLLFAGLIVIAANAGGAWSPIGDVTTTMLWIGGQITATGVMRGLFLPSLINMLPPYMISHIGLRGQGIIAPDRANSDVPRDTSPFERNLIFGLGLAILIAVPIFKSITHLPPYLGILFGLGILWAVGDLVHRHKEAPIKHHVTIAHALSRIDMSSIIFFVGILLAVATLEHTHILSSLASWLDVSIGNQSIIVMMIGLLSAIVDNVPIVAASMGMYSLTDYPPDSFLWEFLAYCAGTGGSILIIGSAAGVAAMGLEKINFIWYVRKMSGLAFVGYIAGGLVYLLQQSIIA